MITLLIGFTLIASTSDIEYVLSHLGEGVFEVRKIVPGGMCPGHFDLSPEDARVLLQGDMLIYHGWEGWIKKVKKMEDHPELVMVNVGGNWMVPDTLKKAVASLASLLMSRIEEKRKRDKITKNKENILRSIEQTSKKIRSLTVPLGGKKAVCNEFIKEQLEYFGMDVVATFPPSDAISPGKMAEIMKHKEAEIVVENRQSIGKVGKIIAEEMGIPIVVISNFPLYNNYEKTLIENVKNILDTLKIDKD